MVKRNENGNDRVLKKMQRERVIYELVVITDKLCKLITIGSQKNQCAQFAL